MNAIGFAFQLDDGGAVHHAIQHGHRQRGVAEVFGPGLEVDVGHQGGAGTLAAGVDDLVPQAGGLRTEAAFDAIEAEFVNDEQAELGIEANAVVDGLVGQGGGEVFEQFAAGDVMDALFQTRKRPGRCFGSVGFCPGRDWPTKTTFCWRRMKSPWARASICTRGMVRIETPVEGAQRQCFAEVGILDETFDAALAAQAGLIGEQAMEELQVRAAGRPGLAARRRRAARPSPGCAGWRSRRGSGHAGSWGRLLGSSAVASLRFFFGRRFIAGFLG